MTDKTDEKLQAAINSFIRLKMRDGVPVEDAIAQARKLIEALREVEQDKPGRPAFE
jgi:hypothetical protein